MSVRPGKTIDPLAVLREYKIGDILAITGASGTAGKTWKVSTSTGDYFLRLRGIRTSSLARLRFDHGLREHLIAKGVPTAAAIETRKGKKWVRMAERVFDLYPFIPGRIFHSGDQREIAHAAEALASFHLAAADYETSEAPKEPVAQYTTLFFPDRVSDRMDDPELQIANMEKVRELAPSHEAQRLVDRCIARAQQSKQAYAGVAYERLTGWVIHGDYTPANLLFSEDGAVVGIFDFDWAFPGARCRDVADGLYFFATQPRRINPSDIWSLTDAADFDLESCSTLLTAYQQIAPLSVHEAGALPCAFAGRWFSIRLEGMAKVKKDERFHFFSREIEKPLLWLDENWDLLKEHLKL